MVQKGAPMTAVGGRLSQRWAASRDSARCHRCTKIIHQNLK